MRFLRTPILKNIYRQLLLFLVFDANLLIDYKKQFSASLFSGALVSKSFMRLHH